MRKINLKINGVALKGEMYASPSEFVRAVSKREHVFGGDAWDERLANDFINSRVDTSSVRKVQTAVNKTATMEKSVRKTYNSVVGYMPNIPRYVMGLPDNMRAEKRVKHKSKIINVYIDTGVPWSCSQSALEDACVRVVEEVLGLEKQGYRINLTAMFSSAMNGQVAFCGVKIKGANQPLNLSRILFPFVRAHDWERSLCFAWYERTGGIKHVSGYGKPLSYVYDDKMAMLEYIKANNGILVLVEDYRRGGIHIADSLRKPNQ